MEVREPLEGDTGPLEEDMEEEEEEDDMYGDMQEEVMEAVMAEDGKGNEGFTLMVTPDQIRN